MEAQNPLSELADIHLPGGISLWPPAYGWWVLLVAIIIGLAVFAYSWWKTQQRKRAMQAALDELDEQWRLYRNQINGMTDGRRLGEEGVKLLNGINSVLRRVILKLYPDTDITSLHGKEWLKFLDSFDRSAHFSEKSGAALGETSYRKTWNEDPAPVFKLAKAWVHRRYLMDTPQDTPHETHKSGEASA